MIPSANTVSWFEIPVRNLERAKQFYQSVFSIQMHDMLMNGLQMVGFPGDHESGIVPGALVKGEEYSPSTCGTLIYFNANPDLTPTLERANAEGARIELEKMLITEEMGYMAIFSDTEGNRVALHSRH